MGDRIIHFENLNDAVSVLGAPPQAELPGPVTVPGSRAALVRW